MISIFPSFPSPSIVLLDNAGLPFDVWPIFKVGNYGPEEPGVVEINRAGQDNIDIRFSKEVCHDLGDLLVIFELELHHRLDVSDQEMLHFEFGGHRALESLEVR